MNNYDEIERKISLIKNYLEDNLSCRRGRIAGMVG